MSAGPALPDVRVARTTAFSCMAGTHLLRRANGVGIDSRGFGQRATFAYGAVIAGVGVRGGVITATHLNSLRLGGVEHAGLWRGHIRSADGARSARMVRRSAAVAAR